MMELFVFVSNFITGVLHVIVCLFLIHKLLKTEKLDKRSLLICLAGVLVITIFLSLFCLTDFLRISLETMWIAVCIHIFQKTDIRMSLFMSIFIEIAISFWQFLIGAGISILFLSTDYLDSTKLEGQLPIWTLHFLLILLVLYISNNNDMTEKKAFRLASMFAFAGLTALMTLSEQTILVIPDDTLDMWMILSIILIMSILIFNINHHYEVERELARLKLDQAELLERDFTTLSSAYKVNAKLFHDFHNHIATVRKLLINNNYAQAIKYLDELQEPIKEITDTIWTGDETVDFLINSKASTATVHQIHLQVQVEFPRHTNIRSTDLCSILGNLLDNALEATKKIPDPSQRKIWLTIRRINHMLVIKVENNFTQIPINENGNLKTSKEGNGLHGWGLKSAQAAAEKYDGMIRTSYEGGIFRAVATLSYHGVSSK